MENTGNINDNTHGDNQFNYTKTGEKIQFPMMSKVYNLNKQTIPVNRISYAIQSFRIIIYGNCCISELTCPGDCLPLGSKYLRDGIILLSAVRAGVNSEYTLGRKRTLSFASESYSLHS